MKRLQIPDWPVKWVFFDNSGDPSFTARLRQFLYEMQDKRSDGSVLTHLQVNKKGKYEYDRIYQLYNDMKQHVMGNWMSFEDDVCEFPVDTISQMYRYAYSTYDLAIIAATMESRRGWPGTMAWRIEDFGEQGLGLRPAESKNEGMSIVDAVHTGCTLMRPAAYSNYSFRQSGLGNKILGHDIHMCVDAKKRGLKTGVIWNLRAGHMSTEGTYYPVGVQNNYLNSEVRISKPLVSVITPTSSRPTLLQRLMNQLKEQTYKHYEHLICNDGFSRFTASMVERNGDERTRYYELGFQHGFSGAPQRNLMIQRAGGELVVFVDDDAEIFPEYLQTMVNLWRDGYVIGFVQIELKDYTDKIRIIPETKDMAKVIGHVDTLCGFVDTAVAKGFFWDLFDEHDARYFQQIISFTRGSYTFTPTILGRNVRSFQRGEDSIPKSPIELIRELSRSYNKPTKEVEALVLTDPHATLQYIMNAREGNPWQEAEEVLASNPNTALFYLTNVLHGKRFEAAEAILGEQLSTAIAYSRITGLRWANLGRQDIEDRIMQDPDNAVDYSIIFGEPWKEAEQIIRTKPSSWRRYLIAGLSSDNR